MSADMEITINEANYLMDLMWLVLLVFACWFLWKVLAPDTPAAVRVVVEEDTPERLANRIFAEIDEVHTEGYNPASVFFANSIGRLVVFYRDPVYPHILFIGFLKPEDIHERTRG